MQYNQSKKKFTTWMMSNPRTTRNNTFGSLGVRNGDTYNVSENCLANLEEILRKLAVEDQTLRTFRRAIGFEQNIRKDLIPLLINLKDDSGCDARDGGGEGVVVDGKEEGEGVVGKHILYACSGKNGYATKIIDTAIKILVDLTVPVECLLPVEAISRTDIGRHTIFELNHLLTTSKEAFTDSRSTKAVMDHMKHVVEKEAVCRLNVQQCESINNCLLLFRNILHIPNTTMTTRREHQQHHQQMLQGVSNCSLSCRSMQNEIIWNLFTQSIDKIIIYLMTCPQKMYWGVTMVQLIALMYKDQHVGTLQKLLNLWLEDSLSESSEDNESNTSPPGKGSGDSSPVVTSDPTSDSSDNGNAAAATSAIVHSPQIRSKATLLINMKRVKSTETEISTSSGVSSMFTTDTGQREENKRDQLHQQFNQKRKCSQSEISDCGYATQVENRESVYTTSSNDDDQPLQKSMHQKPHHSLQKSRYSNPKNRATIALDRKELRRKKLVKRSKTNIINMKGLMLHTPTDEDISNILKEFTVDFLLKGYGNLVRDLHAQLLANVRQMPIDTSHFFWLVTYFLKFAAHLELDLDHVSPVLSYDIISYLTFQGVWLCEELEIGWGMPFADIAVDLKPCLRRLHLVVTAIREYLQAVETYQKSSHLTIEDHCALQKLQAQISQTGDLRHLFLLLLRQYKPSIQSRQYLQDLIVTNHIFLLFLDGIRDKDINIMEHLKQFATVEIMGQYGLLLEEFRENGEFVNNCVFTMMHHIGGDLQHVSKLFQPNILKTFSQIWETDYEICDDWSDLIEYVIHKFINTPRANCCPGSSSSTSAAAAVVSTWTSITTTTAAAAAGLVAGLRREKPTADINTMSTTWTHEDRKNLAVFYKRCIDGGDTIASITKKFQEIATKSRRSQQAFVEELLQQGVISRRQFDEFVKYQTTDNDEVHHEEVIPPLIISDEVNDLHELASNDIGILKEHLCKENKSKLIIWLQNITMEACFAKLALANGNIHGFLDDAITEPSAHHYALLHLPIPVIPWTSEQNNALKHRPFVLLLHNLGFYLPADTGKIFVRIPDFWTADHLFSVAQQLGPIDSDQIKFDIGLLKGRQKNAECFDEMWVTPEANSNGNKFSTSSLHYHGRQTPSMVRYTPLPNSAEWIRTVLEESKIVDVDCALGRSNELSIAIPRIEEKSLPNNLTPPDVRIAERAEPIDMETSQTEEEDKELPFTMNEDTYETTSVASDLTRMCVSDEEEKNI
ncbi:PREDICTED: protein timeless [Nicrophorus vespilloides]|uniref:Protein timeless n=1 Tax=Nicrophorus vespilloides TaxID=110193 RepID=A0ABM1M5M6_NICVS|nr:PREDICTED: protein timeless [Nicrophorus vespilloides]